MLKIEKIKELTAELLEHCQNYYDLDRPTISDKEYDALYDRLSSLENETGFWLANSPTRKVQGQVLDGFKKVTHSKPMLSAAKTKDVSEIKRFVGEHDFYCSYKLDGLTMCCRFENGNFIQAITRGNGEIGEDCTEQAKMINNLPMSIPHKGYLELRGECLISWNNFNKINETLEEPYSHPRNLAAGSLRQLDTNITKERNLSFVVFECVSELYDETIPEEYLWNTVDHYPFDSKWDELGYLDYLGFETVERRVGSVNDCINALSPDGYKYPVDGLIFEMNSNAYSRSLPSTGHHEGCRYAFKWADDTYETVLRDIEWNPTRTGLIAPTAVFDEVDLGGAKTTKATLHNLSVIEELQLGIGDKITVYRSNLVIPKIDDNLTRSGTYKVPNKCPACGADTVIKHTNSSKFLTCPNPNCPAKLIAKFANFVSRNCMNIDGLSEKTLELLVNQGFIKEYKDIYHLSEYKKELTKLPGLGAKSVDKLLTSIEKSRNVKLNNFIAALGIEGIGQSAAKTIAEYFEYDFHNWYTNGVAMPFRYSILDDFGDVMASNISGYLSKNIELVSNLADEMSFVTQKESNNSDNSLSGLKFCITGTFLQSRDALKSALEARGAVFVSSVSKSLGVLFVGSKAGSKLEKARKLGVRIADEEELMYMLNTTEN